LIPNTLRKSRQLTVLALKAYPGETVIPKPNSGANRVMTLNNQTSYFIIDGFIMDGSNLALDAIKLQYEPMLPGGPNHIRIINNEIMNSAAMGVLTGANDDYILFGINDSLIARRDT
jgi:hypothetical protein